MAWWKLMNQPSSGLPPEIEAARDGGGSMETIFSISNPADVYVTAAQQNMHLLKFNREQCEYLIDKLKGAIRSASSFLEVLQAKDHGHPSQAMGAQTIELLVASAKQVESFVQGCCKDLWIESAMTLTNMSEYVSSLGFNLELCRVTLCEVWSGTRSLTLDEVDDINRNEVETVKLKALVDVDALLTKVILSLHTLVDGDRDLAVYLLQSLLRIPTSYDENFLGKTSDVVPGVKLGSGSSGIVYKVMWLRIPAAQKTFFGRENLDFIKEAGVLSQLFHPNIVSMFCCTMDKRTCSIIMELMDEDLYSLFQRRFEEPNGYHPFPLGEALDIMLQIGEAVKYLHEKRIVHMDLKSSNVLVKHGDGVIYAKLASFDLSKKNVASTFSGMTYHIGSTRWMAPEVFKLHPWDHGYLSKDIARISFKCDTYSFAMVCYEILSGLIPFSELSLMQLNQLKTVVLIGSRPILPDHCPPYLKALIERCWDQIPSRRPTFTEICLQLKHMKHLVLISVHTMAGGASLDLVSADMPMEPSASHELMETAASNTPMKMIAGDMPVVEGIPLKTAVPTVPMETKEASLTLARDTPVEMRAGDSSVDTLTRETLMDMTSTAGDIRADHTAPVDIQVETTTKEGLLGTVVQGTGDTYVRIHLGKQLGKGASATVYECVWNGKKCATKLFTSTNAPEFEREVNLLKELCHDNIMSLLDWAKTKHRLLVVMDMMDGDLLQVMQEKMINEDRDTPFTNPVAVDTMLQIACGVKYLHENHIVHRDLKSENILVKRVKVSKSENNFIVKVADFGLSLFKEVSTTNTEVLNVGTNRYMPPELIKLSELLDIPLTEVRRLPPQKVNHLYKGDVYCFALVCCDILTGDRPFPKISDIDVKRMVLNGARPELPTTCPPSLEVLIKDCWNHDPKKRPKFDDICRRLEIIKASLGTDDAGQVIQMASQKVDIASSTSSAVKETESGHVRNRSALDPTPKKVGWLPFNWMVSLCKCKCQDSS
ncbi:hypothetical protein KC19_8G147700 [Ceratodon purpureus]|uniref:Protein kinase domain-containing protein n=1 Tax=Ceratodon purpureus TaxID=3225 RepID=A0A8T0H2D5_CERPU|nr:hypothetical protein KC19_8G147700 [Ceratodon purpureus]